MSDRIRFSAIVLAAGDGKRMKSRLPKVLHPAAGRPLLGHVLTSLEPVRPDATVVVVSPRRDEIEAAMEAAGFSGVTYAVQDPPRGTADGVRVGLEALDSSSGDVLVLFGDTPLLRTETLAALLDAFHTKRATAALLSAHLADPTGYGRIVRGPDDEVVAIVEEADASPEQRAVDEVNAGVCVFEAGRLRELIDKVDRENAQGEFYLSDVFGLVVAAGEVVVAQPANSEEILGVNSRAQLADVTRLLHARTCRKWLDEGVTILDPSTTYIDVAAELAPDVTLLPFTFIEGSSVVGTGARIGPHVRLIDSMIGEDAVASYAVIAGSEIGRGASVGPFASIRPGTKLKRNAKVGTFVETKNTTIGEDSKANHLSYLGDAQIGRDVNIGAGTITCNWDGTEKHETIIEDEAYISSDTMLVAPVRIGRRAATGAGAVVREDVPDDALAVGVPARVIEGRGDRQKKGREAEAQEEAQDRERAGSEG